MVVLEDGWLICGQGTKMSRDAGRAQQLRHAELERTPTWREGQPRAQPNLGFGERGHGHRPAAYLSQSPGQYDTDMEGGCVSQKHEMRILSDFLFLRNMGRKRRHKAEIGKIPRHSIAMNRSTVSTRWRRTFTNWPGRRLALQSTGSWYQDASDFGGRRFP